MKRLGPARRTHRPWGHCAAIVCGGAALLAVCGPALARPSASAQAYATAEAAAQALSAAWRDDRKADLLKIFGRAGEPLVSSGDAVADSHARARLAAAFDKGHRIEVEPGGRAVLVLGEDEWPYPIPLVKRAGTWRFDLAAGAEQIIDRRIGRNELAAVKVSLAYVEAQREYAARNSSSGGAPAYAQRLESAPGRHDGLYWPAAEGAQESVMGPFAAAAEAKGYGPAVAEGRAPFHGYYYRVLTGQGPNASGGAKDYVRNGAMTGGYALLAYPARYGDSGVMTFMVNQNGVVFERNLGRQTQALASAIRLYDPDRHWSVVEPK